MEIKVVKNEIKYTSGQLILTAFALFFLIVLAYLKPIFIVLNVLTFFEIYFIEYKIVITKDIADIANVKKIKKKNA